MALGLILASLDQAFQLVGVLCQTGLQALTRFVLLDESADGLTSLCWEASHLVGSYLGVRGGHHIGLANGGHIPNAGLLGVVEQALGLPRFDGQGRWLGQAA